MSRSLRFLPFLALALLLAGVASCGGSGGSSGGRVGTSVTTVGASDSVSVIQLMHPNTSIVFSASMDGLRRSPYYQTLRDMESVLSERKRQDVAKLFHLLDRTDHFVVGLEPYGSGADDPLIALRGAFDPSVLDEFDELAETELHRAHTLRGRRSEWAVVHGSDTLLFGQRAQVHDGLDRLDRIQPGTGPNRPGFVEAAALAGLGAHDVGAVWLFNDQMRSSPGNDPLERALFENGLSASMALDLQDGLQFQGFVTTNDAAAVSVLADALREALAELPSEPVMVALGLTAIFGQVQITEQGTTLRVALQATDGQVRELLSNFQQFVQSTPRN